jgi:hypothetical protein
MTAIAKSEFTTTETGTDTGAKERRRSFPRRMPPLKLRSQVDILAESISAQGRRDGHKK